MTSAPLLAHRRVEFAHAAARFLAQVTHAFGKKWADRINGRLEEKRYRYTVTVGYPDGEIEVRLHDLTQGTSDVVAGTAPPAQETRPSDRAVLN